jgi:F420-dependent oxidoreductase-like protein
MRFSIWPSPANSWDDTLALAAHCERTGWDGVYFADHFMPNGPGPEPLDGDTLECWSVMAALAASVPRVRLAPLVTSVTYRHPAVLAKIAAAVDQVCHGRLTLGVGAGWQVNEHAAYGLALGTVRERMDRFAEAVQILRAMLSQPRTTFEGQYFEIQNAPNQPAPLQQRMPLLIGGGGEQRTMRLAAQYADHWNTWTIPEVLAHKVSVLRQHCDQAGRDPAEIHVSTQALLFLSADKEWLAEAMSQRRAGPARTGAPVISGTPAEVTEIVGRYAEAGADELIVPDFTLGSLERKKDTCDLFMQEVAPAFR